MNCKQIISVLLVIHFRFACNSFPFCKQNRRQMCGIHQQPPPQTFCLIGHLMFAPADMADCIGRGSN